MIESVRLVVWDLDETFWKGTVTEGGITEYIQQHHDIVIELARRGIMSSICSKNDEATIRPILEEKGILEYFVFPSISWAPKGPRLASLIDAIQLRAPTVLFIDDNPSNLAEAADHVPGLQVSNEQIIPNLLTDPRFKGKDDQGLTRLKQYKLLEERKHDEMQAQGNNEDFLRRCNIKVHVEYDVASHMDRAIELINRTNQLNFTKKRLSEDPAEARKQLEELLRGRGRQAGLIRVLDNYGDYGFVGFFLLENRSLDASKGKLTQELVHYCFSCRTLGMLVEHWFYDHIQRPSLKISGEVLTDLSIQRTIDWIRLIPSIDGDSKSVTKLAPEIRVHGGCEATSIVHYLGPYSDNVVVNGNFFAGAHFVRINSVSLLLSACDRAGPEFEAECAALGIPYLMLVSNYFTSPPEGTVFVFGGQYDCPGPHRYRHKVHGWELKLEPHNMGSVDVVSVPEEKLRETLDKLNATDTIKKEVAATAWHIRANYESVRNPCDSTLIQLMHDFFDRIPIGSKVILMLDDDRVRERDGVRPASWVRHYSSLMTSVAAHYAFAAVVSFTDNICSEEEIQLGGNHYDRMVYYRMAENILARIRTVPAKQANITAAA